MRDKVYQKVTHSSTRGGRRSCGEGQAQGRLGAMRSGSPLDNEADETL